MKCSAILLSLCIKLTRGNYRPVASFITGVTAHVCMSVAHYLWNNKRRKWKQHVRQWPKMWFKAATVVKQNYPHDLVTRVRMQCDQGQTCCTFRAQFKDIRSSLAASLENTRFFLIQRKRSIIELIRWPGSVQWTNYPFTGNVKRNTSLLRKLRLFDWISNEDLVVECCWIGLPRDEQNTGLNHTFSTLYTRAKN